jgi:hypothetical protein
MYFPTLPEFGDYHPLDYFRKMTRNIIGLNTKIKNKNQKRCEIANPETYIHDYLLFWLGPGTIKCKCFLH